MDPVDVGISPTFFFDLKLESYPYFPKEGFLKKHKLPYLRPFYDKPPFATVFCGYNEEGLAFFFEVDSPQMSCFYPKYHTGDAIELFIDTRGQQELRFTPYSHHFILFPQKVNLNDKPLQIKEQIHIKADKKPFDAATAFLEATKTKKGYTLYCFLSKQALHGYASDEFKTLGFNYKIHRFLSSPQQLFGAIDDMNIENHPNMWSHLHLKD